MKILLASREYPPDGLYWGAAAHYHNLAQALVARGHEVHVVCQAWQGMRERREGNILVHEVGTRPKRGSSLGRVNFSIYAALEIRRLTHESEINLIDAPLFLGEPFLLSLFKGSVPLIIQCHAWTEMLLSTKSYSGEIEHTFLRFTSLLEKFAARRADRVIANSRLTYQWLLRDARVPQSKVFLVPHGINTDVFLPTSPRLPGNLDLPNSFPRCLFVGRLQARKGLHILTMAIPSILEDFPTARFIIVGRDTNTGPGGGSVVAHLQDVARRGKFSENLVIDGTFLPTDDLPHLYAACDLLVFPSLSETFGLPVLEAMACGRPVVTTATGIAAELPSVNEALQIVPPGDPAALAIAVKKILSLSNEDRRELAGRLRSIVVERYSEARMVEQLMLAYEGTQEQTRN